MTPQESLDQLIAGNQRFVSGNPTAQPLTQSQRHALSRNAPAPIATILTCSDARVVPETLFDQNVGTLFTIRVAGNIANPSNIGSIEFSVASFGTPLVLVIGHSKCVAVQTTLEELKKPGTHTSENILAIINEIRPAAEPYADPTLPHTEHERSEHVVRANALHAAHRLENTESLAQRVSRGELMIAAAEYDLESGAVELFEL